MKTQEGVEVYLHAFFTLTLDVGDWLDLEPGRCKQVKTPQ